MMSKTKKICTRKVLRFLRYVKANMQLLSYIPLPVGLLLVLPCPWDRVGRNSSKNVVKFILIRYNGCVAVQTFPLMPVI